MPGYTHTRWIELEQALARRLDDPGNSFWTVAENYRYLTEALRTWNAYAQYYRERGSLTLVPPTGGLFFVNIMTEFGNLTPTVTDQDLVVDIQTCLLEPTNATGWSGTSQFTYQQVVEAIQRKRNQFLLETGMVVSQSGDIGSSAPSDGRVGLADTTMDVRRVCWKDADGVYTILSKTDENALNSWRRDWMNPAATPDQFSIAVTPPLALQLVPPPSDAGDLNLLTIQTGADLTPESTATVLGIPDDFCWVIKWGALLDLLSGTNPSVDLPRANYCQARWNEGVALARIASSLMNVQIDGGSVDLSPLYPQDQYYPNWMNEAGAPASQLLTAGWNLFCPVPFPATTNGMSADVVRNMPIPTGPADFVQVGRELIDTILDYAFHLAAFKMGGQEFTTSSPNYLGLVRAAGNNNDKLRANAQSFVALQSKQLAEGQERNRRKSDINLQVMDYAKP